MPKRSTKTFWKEVGDLRRPNANWRLGRAARWWEAALDLPRGAVQFVLPSGRVARSDEKLGSLRSEWHRHQAPLRSTVSMVTGPRVL